MQYLESIPPCPISWPDTQSSNIRGRAAGMIIVIAVLMGCSQTESTSFPYAEVLDSLATAALSEGPIAGLSIAIARDGQVVFEQGYGVTNVESGAPASSATVYNIASTAKILSAVAVVRLVEAGSLSLDDSLRNLLPDIPNVEAVGGITLRQLINMTSGLSDYVGADIERLASSQEPLPRSFVLDYVRNNPLVFEPGSNWIYTNTGFYLAGMIVEKVTGRSWGEYVINEVVIPLGLEHTELCDNVSQTRSSGYEVSGNSFVPSLLDAEQGVRGDAGLCSSVRDLARLPAALERGEVISAVGLELMTSPTELDNGIMVDYGLGVSRGEFGGHALWGHLGGSGSLVSTLAHYPEDKITIAVLVNTRRASLGALVLEGKIAEIVLKLDPALKDEVVNRNLATDLTGAYVGGRQATRFEIRQDSSKLFRISTDDSSSRLELRRQKGRVFGRTDWPYDRLVFQPDKGKAQAYSVYYNGFFDGFYSRIAN